MSNMSSCSAQGERVKADGRCQERREPITIERPNAGLKASRQMAHKERLAF